MIILIVMFFLVHELRTQRNSAFKTIVVVVGGLGNEAFLFNRSEMEKQHFLKSSEKKSSQKPQQNKAAQN